MALRLFLQSLDLRRENLRYGIVSASILFFGAIYSTFQFYTESYKILFIGLGIISLIVGHFAFRIAIKKKFYSQTLKFDYVEPYNFGISPQMVYSAVIVCSFAMKPDSNKVYTNLRPDQYTDTGANIALTINYSEGYANPQSK